MVPVNDQKNGSWNGANREE